MGVSTSQYAEGMIPNYIPMHHPGDMLLPPSDLLKYDSLPKSIRDQILDEQTYDLYGKAGLYLDDGYIDRPKGNADREYTSWLQ